MVLADILFAGVTRWTTMEEAAQIRDLYVGSLEGEIGPGFHDDRYGGLRFLAWLLEGWPHGIGPQVAQDMLRRWLDCERDFASFHLPSDWAGKGGADTYAIGPETRMCVQRLYSDLLRANPEVPNRVRAIIETRRPFPW